MNFDTYIETHPVIMCLMAVVMVFGLIGTMWLIEFFIAMSQGRI